MMTAVIALACPTALWEFAWLEVGLALSLSVTRAQGDPGTMTGTGTAQHSTALHWASHGRLVSLTDWVYSIAKSRFFTDHYLCLTEACLSVNADENTLYRKGKIAFYIYI